ncbi:MAG: hypothetical protein ACR2H0_01210, partial [Candidatus Limnocylindrales bacterium]
VQLERDALVALGAGGAMYSADFEDDIEPAPRTASRLDFAIGLAGAALIALDLAVLIGSRRRTPNEGNHRS